MNRLVALRGQRLISEPPTRRLDHFLLVPGLGIGREGYSHVRHPLSVLARKRFPPWRIPYGPGRRLVAQDRLPARCPGLRVSKVWHRTAAPDALAAIPTWRLECWVLGAYVITVTLFFVFAPRSPQASLATGESNRNQEAKNSPDGSQGETRISPKLSPLPFPQSPLVLEVRPIP